MLRGECPADESARGNGDPPAQPVKGPPIRSCTSPYLLCHVRRITNAHTDLTMVSPVNFGPSTHRGRWPELQQTSHFETVQRSAAGKVQTFSSSSGGHHMVQYLAAPRSGGSARHLKPRRWQSFKVSLHSISTAHRARLSVHPAHHGTHEMPLKPSSGSYPRVGSLSSASNLCMGYWVSYT